MCIEKPNLVMSYDTEIQAQTAETDNDNSGSLLKTFQKPMFILIVIGAMMIGIIFGAVIGIKRGQCVRKQREGQGI